MPVDCSIDQITQDAIARPEVKDEMVDVNVFGASSTIVPL
jgi:hypothetical protein